MTIFDYSLRPKTLTLSPPIPLRLTLCHTFLIFDIFDIKNGGLDQYGAGPFEQQQFGTAGVERVNDDDFLIRTLYKDLYWTVYVLLFSTQ